jgi:hypothetical protein
MKITISYFLVWSYSIFALLFIQRLEALTIQSIEPANFQRLESRAVRRLRARSLQPRAIPHGLYHSCIGGGLSRVCEATIRKGFSTGKLNVIKPEVQSFNDGEHLCKVTVWTYVRNKFDFPFFCFLKISMGQQLMVSFRLGNYASKMNKQWYEGSQTFLSRRALRSNAGEWNSISLSWRDQVRPSSSETQLFHRFWMNGYKISKSMTIALQ